VAAVKATGRKNLIMAASQCEVCVALVLSREFKEITLKPFFKRRPNMASKAKMIGSTEATQPETAVEEREGLPHATHEQEIRNRAYELYLLRGEQPGYELEDWLQAERELSTNLTAVLRSA
jgi:hypothetical protein